MNRHRLSIKAYANGEPNQMPNAVDVEWCDVTMFKSQKDGLQVCTYYFINIFKYFLR